MSRKNFVLVVLKSERLYKGKNQKFQIKIEMESFFEDRNINYITVKNQIESWIKTGELTLGDLEFNMVSHNLYYAMVNKWPDRSYFFEVTDKDGSGLISFYPRDLNVKSD